LLALVFNEFRPREVGTAEECDNIALLIYEYTLCRNGCNVGLRGISEASDLVVAVSSGGGSSGASHRCLAPPEIGTRLSMELD
jgi:hypothetical protein